MGAQESRSQSHGKLPQVGAVSHIPMGGIFVSYRDVQPVVLVYAQAGQEPGVVVSVDDFGLVIRPVFGLAAPPVLSWLYRLR